ncbi:MAG: hypothetical protein UIB39_02060 [Lachnospiraceae bacterium]|jgi:hypothetical protein|nr:hypothetical protein [Lachnospiraceae bacterium]
MMETGEILMELTELARRRPEIRKALLQTADSDRPLSELCRISTELGYPLYEMDLISAGEDYYAAMRRSTNGGGENSPMLEGEDDYYELFLSDLRQIGK